MVVLNMLPWTSVLCPPSLCPGQKKVNWCNPELSFIALMITLHCIMMHNNTVVSPSRITGYFCDFWSLQSGKCSDAAGRSGYTRWGKGCSRKWEKGAWSGGNLSNSSWRYSSSLQEVLVAPLHPPLSIYLSGKTRVSEIPHKAREREMHALEASELCHSPSKQGCCRGG